MNDTQQEAAGQDEIDRLIGVMAPVFQDVETLFRNAGIEEAATMIEFLADQFRHQHGPDTQRAEPVALDMAAVMVRTLKRRVAA